MNKRGFQVSSKWWMGILMVVSPTMGNYGIKHDFPSIGVYFYSCSCILYMLKQVNKLLGIYLCDVAFTTCGLLRRINIYCKFSN